ncbi:hypothetical protein EDB89DRAFT_2062503 [Lactarius sanguifluus]|nr:hypothetical protein EDB89DRAFT_2062503 [Lactarius sanguifluus]
MKWIRTTSVYVRVDYHDHRGDEVISPDSVKSVLAARRLTDMNKDGHHAWRFISIKHWDEYSLRRLTRPSHASLFDKILHSFPGPNELPVGDHPSTTTKAHPKHTEHLPGNHGNAEGEVDKPSFVLNGDPAKDTAEPSSSSSTALRDDSWFLDMSTLISNQRWVFGGRGHSPPLGLTAGVFLCRRAVWCHCAEDYSTLSGNDLILSALTRGGRGQRTEELYDVFGEKSDDEDEDEWEGLRTGSLA